MTLTNVFKWFIAGCAGLFAASLPVWLAANLWLWAVAQIPPGHDWSGLARLGLALFFLLFGTSFTLAAVVGAAVGVFFLALLVLHPDSL